MSILFAAGRLCLAADAPASQRGLDLAVNAAQRLGGNRRALIIGINQYKDTHIPTLRFAEGDARLMRDVLVDPQVGGFSAENVTLLLGNDATDRRIKKALYDLRRAGKDDLIVIYFSGHGAKQGGESFWVTQDAELNDLGPTALSNADLARLLGAIPSERIVTLLDCCYAADTVLNQKAIVNFDDLAKNFSGKGRVTIAGAGAGEEAIEIGNLKHGVFTHFLAEGLRGAADADNDGVVTLKEEWDYLEKNVAQAARQERGIQRPTKHSENERETDRFLLTLNPARAADVLAALAKLKTLFERDKITSAQFEEGKRLLSQVGLTDAEREKRDIYLQLCNDKLDAQFLTKVLSGITSDTSGHESPKPPPQDDAQLKEAKRHWEKGRALLKKHDIAGASTAFKDATQAGPFAPAYADLARVYIIQSSGKEAQEASAAAIKLDPDMAVAHAYRSYALSNLGKAEEAIKLAQKAIDLDPRCSDAHAAKASAFTGLFDGENSIEEAQQAVELDPSNCLAQLVQGYALVIGGKTHEGIAACEKALTLEPRLSDAFLCMAFAKVGLSDFEGARADLAKALKLQPSGYNALFIEGFIKATIVATPTAHARSSDLPEAMEAAQKAVRLDPNRPEGYLVRGMVHMAREEMTKAEADFDRGIEVDTRQPLLFIARGALRQKAGNLVQAEADYQSALVISRSLPVAHLFLGTLRVQQMNVKGALDEFTKAIELAPDVPEPYEMRAQLFQAIGKFDDAQRDSRKAQSLRGKQSSGRGMGT